MLVLKFQRIRSVKSSTVLATLRTFPVLPLPSKQRGGGRLLPPPAAGSHGQHGRGKEGPQPMTALGLDVAVKYSTVVTSVFSFGKNLKQKITPTLPLTAGGYFLFPCLLLSLPTPLTDSGSPSLISPSLRQLSHLHCTSFVPPFFLSFFFSFFPSFLPPRPLPRPCPLALPRSDSHSHSHSHRHSRTGTPPACCQGGQVGYFIHVLFLSLVVHNVC